MLRPLTDLSAFSHSGRAGCAEHDGQETEIVALIPAYLTDFGVFASLPSA